MRTRFVPLFLLLIALTTGALAQEAEPGPIERHAPLTESAIALDGLGQPALEGSLLTTALNGAPDTPVANIRMVVRNVSPIPYAFVSGIVTFYAPTGVRCGAGIFKADALAINESFETDTPGIRITCEPATWRLIATHLVPRTLPGLTPAPQTQVPSSPANLIISINGEEYPIQLDRPLVLVLGDQSKRIVVRRAP